MVSELEGRGPIDPPPPPYAFVQLFLPYALGLMLFGVVQYGYGILI